jgi:hypothetical protein
MPFLSGKTMTKMIRCSFDNQIVVSEMFRKVIKANKFNCMSFAKELEIYY